MTTATNAVGSSSPAEATDRRYSRASYDVSRKSWQDHIEMFGLTRYNMPRLQAAYALWEASRPEFTDGDNWLTAAEEWQHTYLATRHAVSPDSTL
ncbi:hypothetical protein [Streptomyces sp. NPDC047985]|uniref:hypothetical protein n=1 Tax=Streptomyces sp. NPDC047985 TaxID=3155384 RepID=UPI0034162D5A